MKSQLREELLPEASFRMSVKESELSLDFNYGTLALKYVCDARGVYAQYFDGERRLSIHNDKLMDMRRLRVVKGDEALKETKELLSSAESLVNEGITEAQTFFSVDFSLVRRAYSAIAANVKVDPRAFLDIKVSQVSIDVNREFRRDVPGLVSARRMTVSLVLVGESEPLTVKVLEDVRREYYVNGVVDPETFHRKVKECSVVTSDYLALIKSLITI
ncbi:MAG: hypothetical protein L7H12_08190 [Sulfolobales archaeon]|nr:hypothetical protein [Sulfolobales archaeon]